MKAKLFIIPTLTILGLAACATKPADKAPDQTAAPEQQPAQAQAQPQKLDRIIQVAYTCGTGKQKQAIVVKYGVIGEDLAVAQISANGANSPVLVRDKNATNADTENLYTAEGYTWTTDLANAANVTKTDGNMLTQGNEILLKYCQLNKKATASLNKAK